MTNKLKEKLKLVPHEPGSYQMKDNGGVIIYVGKAKDLYKRLNSYFKGTVTGKTRKMVSEVVDFTFIVTNTETEAFLTEINLIKEYNPKYNILLKDDKSYPYIEFIRKPYPRLKVSRYLNIKKKDKKLIFGPYPNAYAARRLVKLINRLYPLKKCNGMPKNVCLYYHIGECLGYCTKAVNENEIEKMSNEILSFLKGNDKILKAKIMARIDEYSKVLNYEMAKELADELKYIDIVLEKQKVELRDFVNRDVIGIHIDKSYIGINILFIRNNKLIGSNEEIITIKMNEIDEVHDYILNFYERHEIPKEIFIDNKFNEKILEELLNTTFVSPQKGIKSKLLKLANKNALINLENEIIKHEKENMQTEGANENLRKILNLKYLRRIDIFDNSNLFGTFCVSGMVVFVNGRASKKDYRKYKISLQKNDDYHAMQEVIYRRYQRALSAKEPLPDLILVDGGINQINACKRVLNSLNLAIKVCGLKKNAQHKTSTLIYGDTMDSIILDKDSSVFHYLTRMQDEVHRYTIDYHRTLRNKGSISSILDKVPGITETRKKELIKKYGNIANIKKADFNELKTILSEETIKNLQEFLNQNEDN